MKTFAWLLFAAVLAIGCARKGPAHVHAERPVVRLMPNGAGALYVDLVNDADAPDRLLSVDSSEVGAAQLHTMVEEGDVVAMKPAEGGFELPARGTVRLEKGRRHVMLFGVKRPDRALLPLTLHFERAGSLIVVAPVVSAVAETHARRVLRVCADPNNMPFSNDRREGFENELAKTIADDLGADLAFTWAPQRRGFVRETLKAGRCDVVMGVPTELDMLATTNPYYRSGYAFVYAPGAPRVRSLSAPELHRMRIGMPLVGDDGANPPPAFALGARDLVANVRGFSVYGDYRNDSPPADAIRALRRGELDVAIALGPVAGWFAKGDPALEVALLPESEAPKGQTFTFPISLGVRRSDLALRDELDAVLAREAPRIASLLDRYGVPRR